MATSTPTTPKTPKTPKTPSTPGTPSTPSTPSTPATPATLLEPTPPSAPQAARDGPPAYGERELIVGCKGPDVAELQTRLAGFRGTLPDGDFGGGTLLQVTCFQRDFMKMAAPTGVVDRATFVAIDAFADQYPIDFKLLRCPCGVCPGYGQGFFKGLYAVGQAEVEMNYRYEYPGMHRLLLWAVRAIQFYTPNRKLTINSGYRCSVENASHTPPRTSTNHHGKAVDLDVVPLPKEDAKDDMANCDALRGRLIETANAQLKWLAKNQKALEPSDMAPIWVHYDVRCYERKYLGDEAFCTSNDALDARRPITC
jgi:hypothetical protein